LKKYGRDHDGFIKYPPTSHLFGSKGTRLPQRGVAPGVEAALAPPLNGRRGGSSVAKRPGLAGFSAVMVQGSLEWLPSQNGAVLECLQPHQATVLASVISVFCGAKPEPLCDPSQKGWLLD
jgi:hypothetical protein